MSHDNKLQVIMCIELLFAPRIAKMKDEMKVSSI